MDRQKKNKVEASAVVADKLVIMSQSEVLSQSQDITTLTRSLTIGSPSWNSLHKPRKSSLKAHSLSRLGSQSSCNATPGGSSFHLSSSSTELLGSSPAINSPISSRHIRFSVVIGDDVVSEVKQLRSRTQKSMVCVILKIDPKSLQVSVEKFLEDTFVEEVQLELKDEYPRLLAISYERKHSDGRISHPLIGLHYKPEQASEQQKTLYASSLHEVFHLMEITKIYNLSAPELLTNKFLQTRKGSSQTKLAPPT